MTFRWFSLGVFSLAAFGPLASVLSTPASAAACVGVDVSNQVALHGNPDGVEQSNEVQMEATPNCFGSASVSADTQLYTGPDVVQERESQHYLDGSYGSYGQEYLPYEGDDIFIEAGTQTEVYVAPYDPNYSPYDPNFYDSYLGDPISPAYSMAH